MAETYANASNRLELLKALEKLEAMDDLRPEEAKQLATLRASRQGDQAAVDETDASYRGFANGVSFGLADELQAGVESLAGGDYGDSLSGIRSRDKAAEAKAPGAYNMGKMAGVAGSAAVPLGVGMSMVRGAPLAVQMTTGATVGAGMAAAEGFASAEGGDGSLWDQAMARGGKAMQPLPLAIGAGFGAAGPLAGRIAGGAIGGAASPVGRPVAKMGYRPAAARLVSRSFSDDALGAASGRGLRPMTTPDPKHDIARFLSGLGPEGMIADAGRNTRLQASGVTRLGGPGAQRLATAVDARAAAAPQRIRATLDSAGGAVQDQAVAAAGRAADRSAQANPLYEAAKAQPGPMDMRIAAYEIKGMIDDRMAGAKALRATLADIQADPRPIVVHNKRVELRGMRDEAVRSGDGAKVITYERALQALDRELDKLPGYAKARSIWADSKALDGAAEEGAKLLRPSTRSDQLRLKWGGMSEPEKEAFRKAARAEIQMEMGRAVQEGNRGLNLIGPTENRAKLEIVFGKDAADEIGKRVDAEKVFRETRTKVAHGSETAANQRAADELRIYAPTDGIRMGPVGRARDAVNVGMNRAIDAALFRAPGEGTLDDLSRILSAQGSDRDAIVRALLADTGQVAKNQRITNVGQRILQSLIQSGGAGLAVSGRN